MPPRSQQQAEQSAPPLASGEKALPGPAPAACEPASDDLPQAVRAWSSRRWRSGVVREENDSLAVEEPLEIRLGGKRFTVTMRTPGHDEELAAGFLLAEGFVETGSEIAEIRRLRSRGGALEPNLLDVVLGVPADSLRQRLKRNFVMSSSCGLCGKTSIESLCRRLAPLSDPSTVSAAELLKLAPAMRRAQRGFSATGGLHAAALFVASPAPAKGVAHGGEPRMAGGTESAAPRPLVIREDVGRHNAVDKVLGYALLNAMVPATGMVLVVSGRLSFEIVQKAAAARAPIVAAVSAPTSLAVELASEVGITLVGFLREAGFNTYSRPERIRF